MTKRLILVSVIFVFVSCDDCNYISPDVRQHYQFLLKKWRESTNWEEQKAIDSIPRKAWMRRREVHDIARKAIIERYSLEEHRNFKLRIERIVAMGKQEEHWLVFVTRWPDHTWILISRTDRNILAMESYTRDRHDIPYMILLDRWRFYDYNRQLYMPNYDEHVDSVAAIAIAHTAAEKRYGFEMLFIAARLMGIYKNHWMIYFLPVIPPSTVAYYTGEDYYTAAGDFIPRDQNYRGCYRIAVGRYRHKEPIGVANDMPDCPQMVVALISKESGSVLFMGLLEIEIELARIWLEIGLEWPGY